MLDKIELGIESIVAVLAIAAAVWITREIDASKYNSLKAEYASYQAQAESNNAESQESARRALQAQIDMREATERNNAQVIASLHSDVDNAKRDADVAHRLFARAAAEAAKPSAPSSPVPEAQGGLTADATTAPRSNGPGSDFLGDVTAAVTEARECFEHYTALQLELSPQLEVGSQP